MSTIESESRISGLETFRALGATTSTAELLVALDGRILGANNAAVRLLGGDRAAIEGSSLMDWTHRLDAEDEGLVKNLARTTAPLVGSLTLTGRDGGPIACRYEGGRVPATPDGLPPAVVLRLMPRTAARSGFTVLTQQIFDLRKEVARRRHAELLLEHQKDLLELIVADLPLADVLAAIATFIEQHSEHSLCSILLLDSERHLRFGAAPSLPAAYNEAIDGLAIGEQVGSCGTAAYLGKTVVVENIASDPLWEDFRGLAAEHGLAACWSQPIRGPRGVVLGTLAMYYREPGSPTTEDLYLTAVGVDLTAIAILSDRSRSTLKLRAEQLAEADRRKDRFLAMLSHELRNPLAPIVNTLEILGEKANNPEQLAHVDRLKRQTTHLNRLVDDLLDLSRVSHGAIELKVKRVDLRECIAQAVDSVADRVAKREQTLTVPEESRPIWIDGDEHRLRQIFANLLGNAAKYTQSGGAIEVDVEVDRDADQAVTHVRDNGEGLSPELQKHLFEPFLQGAKNGSTREGLGLGLALVHQLVACHDGEVEVHSDGEGRGSEFTVRLPLAAADDESAARSGSTAVPEEQVSLKVLLAEDNRDSAEALGILLGLWGHVTTICHDGDKAVAKTIELEPDVILLDIDLPGQDGYSVLRTLRKMGFSTTRRLAVAMTGFGRLGDVEASKSAGFHHHMTKPADPKALRKLLADFAAESRRHA